MWRATPAVLSCCNEQRTYEMPGAASAYAWLHLLDRYVRTWIALEKLVVEGCIPLARYGVRTLDVGTGPGPSAFAVHDFYATMTEFANQTGNAQWRQPPRLTCVEFDSSTSHLRHHLAETVFEQSQQKVKGVLAMCHSMVDFADIMPSRDRKLLLDTLRRKEDEYFDEEVNQWVGESYHSADEANETAQSLHRYRLIMFSNFLTTVGAVYSFKANLVDIFHDARPGTVITVIGGKRGPYPEIYEYVDRLAKPAGFQLEVAGSEVSSEGSTVAEGVYAEGERLYRHLQSLARNEDDETRVVREHFEGSRQAAPSSQLWAYRKHDYARGDHPTTA